MNQPKHLFGKFYFANGSYTDKPGVYNCGVIGKRVIPMDFLNHPQLVEFPEQTVVIAKDQPEYRPLPAHVHAGDEQGKISFCWKLSWWHRLKVLFTGKLWHQVLTFNHPLQPQMLLTTKPEMKKQK